MAFALVYFYEEGVWDVINNSDIILDSGGTTCVWAPGLEKKSGPHNSLPEII